MKKTDIAVIPAYKPTSSLIKLSRELRSEGFSVVIVDDGSGEKYEQIFSACSDYARVLRHKRNRGKGAAMKTGFSHIMKNYAPEYAVVTVDADGQHTVSDALSVCREAEKNPGALILGGRKLKEKVPFRSRVGNIFTRLIFQLSTGSRIRDTQTGLRAFDSSLLPTLLKIPGERYEYEMNELLYFTKHRIKIIETEIETIYIDNNSSSHFHPFKDSVRIIKEILFFSASSFFCFLIDYAMYALFLSLTYEIALSNILARMISASVNFALNKSLVFKNKQNTVKSAAKYLALALFILAANTVTLQFITEIIGIDRLAAKIVTEVLFFILSWTAQRFIVFKKRGDG